MTKEKKTRMFPFITHSRCNPVGVRCRYGCLYCWANTFAKRYHIARYLGDNVTLFPNVLAEKYPKDSFVFVEDMSDLLQFCVPDHVIERVLELPRNNPDSRFLFLTKNPARYHDFCFPSNCVLGATIESNTDYPELSHAPKQTERIQAMLGLVGKINRTFVSIEPILDFNLDQFADTLNNLALWGVAIGFDNYGHKLPEVSLDKTLALIDRLERSGITVFRKTIRKPWNEILKPCAFTKEELESKIRG